MKLRLDGTDWKILRELQADGRMTNVELARRVGISAPPCLRRVRALEQSGVIRCYRALLDERALGYDISAFAFVGLKRQSEHDLIAFEDRLRDWDIVREAWMLSGEVDFLLMCVAETLRHFQDFVIRDLTTCENVDGVRTTLTIRQSKNEPRVAIAGALVGGAAA